MDDLRKTVLQLAKERRSIRRFSEKTIDLDKILEILEVARHAPSGINMQPWIYIVVTDTELKERIRRDAEREEKNLRRRVSDELKRSFSELKIQLEKSFLTEAPVLIVIAGMTSAPYWLESTWISIAYMLLSVESLNLGTLTYTPPETAFLNKLLKIPKDYTPVTILPVGIPAEKPHPNTRPRKPLEQLVHMNYYQSKE